MTFVFEELAMEHRSHATRLSGLRGDAGEDAKYGCDRGENEATAVMEN